MTNLFKTQKKLWKRSSFFTVGITAALIAACSVQPEPVGDWERAVRVDSDIQEMFGNQRSDVILRPITLYDAMARAMKYNLNSRLKMMETALTVKQFDVSGMEMLPSIAAGAGYAGRNNYEAIVSKSMRTGVLSDPTAYSAKTRGFADIQVSWNILDFGVSYYQAKQDANKILMAKERRRKQTQALLQDVRNAFWRAIAAERLTPVVDELMEESTFALEQLRIAQNENTYETAELLSYQMTLMETMRDLSEMKKELLMSRDQLAALMNVKPGTRFRLVGPEEGNYVLPEIRSNLDRLEWLALMNRPELREEDYKLQNTRLQAKQALVKMMPNLNLFASGNYDSDSYLTNNSWLQAAAQVGYNLLNPMKMQETVSAAEVKEAVDNLNRQVISMAVLTQTHLGWARYQGAKETYQLSVEISNVAEELAQQTSVDIQATDPISQAVKISAGARSLFAKLRTAMNFAELQDATGYMFVTLGLDALPSDFAANDVPTISLALERVMGAWDMGRFTNEDAPRLPPVPMRRPPVFLNVTIPMRQVVEDSRFIATIPPKTFAEAELGHDVAYTATMLNGEELPAWMYFDSKTITLSGKPPATSEGFYEIKITARNKKKMTAYVVMTVQVMRGYRTMMDMRGAERNATVTVIQKCEADQSCNNNQNVRRKVFVPEKVSVSPLYMKKKN